MTLKPHGLSKLIGDFLKTNKTGTSKVGAISKAQKAQKTLRTYIYGRLCFNSSVPPSTQKVVQLGPHSLHRQSGDTQLTKLELGIVFRRCKRVQTKAPILVIGVPKQNVSLIVGGNKESAYPLQLLIGRFCLVTHVTTW